MGGWRSEGPGPERNVSGKTNWFALHLSPPAVPFPVVWGWGWPTSAIEWPWFWWRHWHKAWQGFAPTSVLPREVATLARRPEEPLTSSSQEVPLGVKLGDRTEVSKTITDAVIKTYANLSGDDNPLHVDAVFAQKTRFKGRIGQGMLTASLISTALTRLTKGLFIYVSQDLRFTAPVHLGDTITATAEVIELLDRGRIRLRTVCTNQRGEMVLEGFAEMKRLKEVPL